ncbi:hypothetical protein ENKO_17120 [Enterobacter kobei]|uniref:Uncharacterized protein n=1 Tax=Enterobacter kobei TaxID=208224 RepID=A0AA86J2K2_9ENTR|nr:hypothetical protein ENKO_17120 [Enterobacter kobei]
MITVEMRKVYFSPSRGRHFLTRRAAIRAEAHAKIVERHPYERPDYDNGFLTYPGYSIKHDEPERYQKILRRMMRIIDKHTDR